MTLEEGIKHAEEVAQEMDYKYQECLSILQDYKAAEQCDKCAEEHRQLAEWLKELKKYKEKDTPKLVIYSGDGYADGKIVYDWATCPSCNFTIEESDADWEMPFCCACGQRLKWGE